MGKWEEYYKKTYNKPECPLLITVINEDKSIKNAIDLGCGVGNETIYLVKNNIQVLAIDANLKEDYILSRLNEKEKSLLTLQKIRYEKVILPNTDLIIANFSIPFCNPKHFDVLWQKIKEAINQNGYFLGQIFGNRDSWNKSKSMTFKTKEEAINLLKGFDIILFEEKEFDEDNKRNKHWHYFNIIIKKDKGF